MHVCLNRVGHLVVDDKRDVLHIDTTSREIGGHENVGVPVSERLQSSFSLFLILAGVQSRGAPLQRSRINTGGQHRMKFGLTPAR